MSDEERMDARYTKLTAPGAFRDADEEPQEENKSLLDSLLKSKKSEKPQKDEKPQEESKEKESN